MALNFQQLFNKAEDGRAMPTPTPITSSETQGKQPAAAPAATPTPQPKQNIWVKQAQNLQDAINKTGDQLVTRNLGEGIKQPMQQLMQQQREQQREQQAAETTVPATQPAATPQQPSTTQEIIDYLQAQADAEKAKMETPEQKAKREKREKWSAAISSIGDAASSIANLYFTSQYAPNMYSGQNTLSAANQARIEKAKAEREKTRDNYINYALKIGQLKDNERDWQYKQQLAADKKAQQEFDNKLALAKEQRDQAMQALNMQLTLGKIDEQAYKAKTAEAEAKYAEDVQKANIAKTQAQTNASKASAAASYANARNANARTAKVYHDMAEDGSGRKRFATGASVKQRNWDNDDYIEQLYSQLKSQSSYRGTDGKKHVVSDGTRDLFKGTDLKITDTSDRASKINLMRGAIEELLTNQYDPGAQAAMGGVMEDFDERYSPKKK